MKLRRVNDINKEIERQIDYYENNRDYSDNVLDFIGDQLRYDGVDEEEIHRLMNADLYTDTDYSYLSDDAIAVFPVGEIEILIDTDLTKKEYNVIANQLDYSSTYNGDTISVFICTGMNVRVYENKETK